MNPQGLVINVSTYIHVGDITRLDCFWSLFSLSQKSVYFISETNRSSSFYTVQKNGCRTINVSLFLSSPLDIIRANLEFVRASSFL